jgi:hypothetical protein
MTLLALADLINDVISVNVPKTFVGRFNEQN